MMRLGFTLLELIAVIIILGVIAGLGAVSINRTVQAAKFEAALEEMELIRRGVVGTKNVYTGGKRFDFGFIGEYGKSKKLNWKNLAEFMGSDTDDLMTDPWGNEYKVNWSGVGANALIISTKTPDGDIIEKTIASDLSELYSLQIEGFVKDSYGAYPLTSDLTNIKIELQQQNGAVIKNIPLQPGGRFVVTGIPIGNHKIIVEHTIMKQASSDVLSLLPGKDVVVEIVLSGKLPGTTP